MKMVVHTKGLVPSCVPTFNFSLGRRDLSHEQFTSRDQHHLRGQVPATCPTNSNMGQVAGTKFWSLRLDFPMKMVVHTKGLVPSCVPTFNFSLGRRDLSHEQFTSRDQHHLRGQVPATCPTNSNMGQVAGTKFWSLRLDFLVKMGSSHEGTWSPELVEETSRRD